MKKSTIQHNNITNAEGLWQRYEHDRRQWYNFIILVFLIKLTIYFFDHTPMFFLGDSRVYLNTAVNGWIPTDRSFVYGFFIKFVTGQSHSLYNLILLQTMLGGVSAIIVAYILKKFFALSSKTAFAAGLLCAVEPLQLFYERYAMTETPAIFVFAVYTLLVLYYLKRPGIIYIFALQLIGLTLISLRMSYLPLVLLVTVLLPFLGTWAVWLATPGNSKLQWGVLGGLLLLHLIFSVCSMYLMHGAYKNLLGNLVDRSPAYRYEDGVTLMACWSPLIEPEDFFDKTLGKEVFSRLTINPKAQKKRAAQRYWDGGLVHVLWSLTGSRSKADIIARSAAVHAARRNPVGLLRLYLAGFNDYWNIGFLKGLLRLDRGCLNKPYPQKFVSFLHNNFNYDASCADTLVSRYFFGAWPWYPFLLLTPFWALLLFCNRFAIWPYIAVLFVFSCFLMTIPATFPDVRYIQPLGWLIFIVFPLLISRIMSVERWLTQKSSG